MPAKSGPQTCSTTVAVTKPDQGIINSSSRQNFWAADTLLSLGQVRDALGVESVPQTATPLALGKRSKWDGGATKLDNGN